MLTKEANELLTRVSPGTPMGKVFRRFWLPALLVEELEMPDSPPVRLRLLCEDLVAFRDTSGRVGIIEAYCSHRLAPLFFGRNEENGLRCAYHGWKFDVEGNCIDMPNVDTERDLSNLRKRCSLTAYPTREAGGVVWVYMGLRDQMPELPHFEWTTVPKAQRYVSRWIQRTNWAQGMEGEIDTSHISFLHKEMKPGDATAIIGAAALDGAPQITLKETDYGFTYGARRDISGQKHWRMTHWLAPMFSLIPHAPGDFKSCGGRAWVPIDDNNTTTFSYAYRIDRAYTEDEIKTYQSGSLFPPRIQKGTVELPNGHVIDKFVPLAHKGNDYLIDREMQRTVNFSGIWGANEQDRALQESMRSAGPEARGIVDRTREHPVNSDVAVVTARRILLRVAQELKDGIEPSYPAKPGAYGVRAISKVGSISEFDDFMRHYQKEILAPSGDSPPAAPAPDRKSASVK